MYALWTGKRQRWRVELRVEAAHTEHKIGVVAEIHEQPHFSFHCHKQDARVEHGSKKPDPAFIKFQSANKCHINDQQRRIFCWQGSFHYTNYSNIAWYFYNDAKSQADKCRG